MDKHNRCDACIYFECVDIDGSFLDKGYCSIQDLYTYVEDDGSCDSYVLSDTVMRDKKDGCYD